ncbi:hypothetical protein DWB61_17395 [Ancylomarina euxinus]|uniref:Uncharacterized protein n=1 Tax=Ancylomarina euxinus TaxID=2283627 RepID=A0A425XWF5_9BACT|nr:hypothetical protein [Ancylomarina euxinus]MCZ4696438.1 hypothetical protein [Ancylomarina euxinus]RRG18978.1 hypothetical protein DWB61_17395 [Ancylomarina euxinus]
MSKEKEILEIERIKESLEYHFDKYKEYKSDAKNASRKKDRDRASDNMVTHAKFIENELYNPLVNSTISNGGQFQFESFWRYVESDLPDYLSKIEALLDQQKSEEEEKKD